MKKAWDQPELFDPEYPDKLYGGAPPSERVDTSVAAADEIEAVSGRLRREVYDALRFAGTEGLTDDELEVKLEMRHQTVSARRRELVLAGHARWSGEKRFTRSGRQARVWVAT